MGVKGLQYFVENICPDVCVRVNLAAMAACHKESHAGVCPVLVVDGMSCLRHWYGCLAWVHGGQWQEYLQRLGQFVQAFHRLGVRLVFFFDGVVEDKKRDEWARRRLRVNREIAGLFKYVRQHGEQPGGDAFCLPSGLATFTRFALKSLDQETWCTVQEADFEIASYARNPACMGILGLDTDFLIFDSAPYLSVHQLRLETMSTVLLCRRSLCGILQLHTCDLPLLACILGNDSVPEHRLRRLRSDCLAEYHRDFPASSPQADKIFAVADFIRRQTSRDVALLPVSDADRAMLQRGVRAYLLPGQRSPWVNCELCPETGFVMEKYSSPDILQAAKEKHIKAECFLAYNVLHDGVVECSNTLEDGEDTELPPQADVYKAARQRIYGLLLSASAEPAPTVKEWFVSPTSLLREPDCVSPLPLNLSGDPPDLRNLWFGKESNLRHLRFATFLAIFDLERLVVDWELLPMPLVGVVCLVTYLTLQIPSLSLEDVDAFLSQAVCVWFKSCPDQLRTEVTRVEARAVHLGSLFVRGLTMLVAANSACGFPFLTNDLMPWRTFDGLLFHSKYLLAHSSASQADLMEGCASWGVLFQSVRELVMGICGSRGRVLTSRPRGPVEGKPTGGVDRSPEHFKGSGPRCPPPQFSRAQTRGPRAHTLLGSSNRPRGKNPNRDRCHLAPRWNNPLNP